ncbi:MAG: hypothetical protein RL368_864, partial [Pseudomonadota bacterium]
LKRYGAGYKPAPASWILGTQLKLLFSTARSF